MRVYSPCLPAFSPSIPAQVWLDPFGSLLVAKKMTNQFFWCLNPNSVDTGGLLKVLLSIRLITIRRNLLNLWLFHRMIG